MAGIVVGVDGSTGSARALDWALHAAALYRQPLTVVAVVPTPVLPTGWSTRPVVEPATPAELEATRQAVWIAPGRVEGLISPGGWSHACTEEVSRRVA